MIRRLHLLCFLFAIGIFSCKKGLKQDENETKENIAQSTGNVPTALAGGTAIVSFTKDNSTSVTELSCEYDANNPAIKYIVYTIGPLSVQAGDVVTTHMQRELVFTGTAHVMIGCGILVGTSPTAIENTSPGYLGMASPFSGNNLYTAAEGNISIMSRTGSYKFSSASNSIYINAVFFAEKLGPVPGDLQLPAGSNYGELVAVVERGVERYSSTAHYTPYISGYGYSIPTNGTLYVDNSVGPLNIPPNTMVDVRYQNEITSNDNMDPEVLRVGRKTIYTSSASSTAGVNLTSPSQAGMLKFTRHLTSSHVGGAFFASGGASNAYFNSVLWAHDGKGYAPMVENGGSANYLYGNYSVELRPYVYFGQDYSRNITAVDATERVLYSVGPVDIDADQVVEVRYVGVFGAPASIVPFRSRIVRGTSATATTGVTVQSQLYRKYGPSYVYNNAFHSTAERPATAQTGQYYNVVTSVPSGGSLPVMDWGELEVVKR